MSNHELGKIYRIKESVTHQGIGGKEIQLERYLTPDEVDERGMNGNIACLNFCMRRDDFLPEFNMNLYYGHVGNLGYVVCEDELEEVSSTPDHKKGKRASEWLKIALKRVFGGKNDEAN